MFSTAPSLVHLPDEVSFVEGAAAMMLEWLPIMHCSLKEKQKEGMKVGIVGIGGLGQFMTQMAVIAGCEVYAVDTSEKARELAHEIGCHGVYDDVMKLKEIQQN